ncbi:MAG: cytochrome c3 family protein, partial [candidate division NC10 bacterium]|nr:cytochrome c3 family protein [candidate division NC10 bacterium]
MMILSGLFLGLIVVGVARPAEAAGPTAQECLGCHADKDLTKQVSGKAVSLFTDEALLKKSVHGRLECTACHSGISGVPHAEKLPPVACQTCHAGTARAFAASIHGRTGGTPRVSCQSCHGSHAVGRAADLGAEPCQACHGPVTRAYLTSVHARALARGIQDASLCFDCHGEAHRLRSHLDPESPTFHARTAETCGRCHADRALVERRHIPIPQAYQLYQKSVHGRAVA